MSVGSDHRMSASGLLATTSGGMMRTSAYLLLRTEPRTGVASKSTPSAFASSACGSASMRTCGMETLVGFPLDWMHAQLICPQ